MASRSLLLAVLATVLVLSFVRPFSSPATVFVSLLLYSEQIILRDHHGPRAELWDVIFRTVMEELQEDARKLSWQRPRNSRSKTQSPIYPPLTTGLPGPGRPMSGVGSFSQYKGQTWTQKTWIKRNVQKTPIASPGSLQSQLGRPT